MKSFVENIILRGRKITYLIIIIHNIKRDIMLQRIFLSRKDYKEVKAINEEILSWLKELGL